MRLPWLLAMSLVGGGAAATMPEYGGGVSIADSVLSLCIATPKQLLGVGQCSPLAAVTARASGDGHGAAPSGTETVPPARPPLPGLRTTRGIPVDATSLKNQTKPEPKPKRHVAPRKPPSPDRHGDALPVVTLRAAQDSGVDTNAPQTGSQQPRPPPLPPGSPPSTESESDPGPASASSSSSYSSSSLSSSSSSPPPPDGKDAGNPASANRAIAGMSAGLLSVLVIFTVFL